MPRHSQVQQLISRIKSKDEVLYQILNGLNLDSQENSQGLSNIQFPQATDCSSIQAQVDALTVLLNNHKNRHITGGADSFLSTDLIEALVRRVRSVTADLIFGTIADGDFLKRDGVTIVGAAGGGGASGPAGGVLSGTYPNPGFAVDMAEQTELDVVEAAAVMDGDTAGGDLAGTYPNPNVAKVHETSGPTQLTIGAIDDGEFLKRSGANIISDTIAGGGGASSAVEYVTTASDGGLSNEVVIPGLAGNGNIKSLFGGVFSEEWDNSTPGMTANGALAQMDSDTTRPSHLYIRHNANANRYVFRSWTPGSGAFDVRLNIAEFACADASGYTDVGLIVCDDTVPTNGVLMISILDRSANLHRLSTYDFTATAASQHGSNWDHAAIPIILRIQRDGSNNITTSWSRGGYAFIIQVVFSYTFTVNQVGIRVASTTAVDRHAYFDYLRAQ